MSDSAAPEAAPQETPSQTKGKGKLKGGMDASEMGKRGAAKREANRAAKRAATVASSDGVTDPQPSSGPVHGDVDGSVAWLEGIAGDANQPGAARVAAIRTLEELRGVRATTIPTAVAQVRAMSNEELHAYALQRGLALPWPSDPEAA